MLASNSSISQTFRILKVLSEVQPFLEGCLKFSKQLHQFTSSARNPITDFLLAILRGLLVVACGKE